MSLKLKDLRCQINHQLRKNDNLGNRHYILEAVNAIVSVIYYTLSLLINLII